ncbi:TonB-dependent receptor [Labilibaculum sp. DW002]|uniref:TonB-dependent receptor n=1 Tax=Paralabilibaculum antarcticum TaxID=2912572 RepID=A0ABT5VY64_9BACT|nr:TonB-dependent receptor [Labilibaculum sp. DW002]MDE5419234.1 TonB-dependent receptor [Labilibaculum sp. DW002]
MRSITHLCISIFMLISLSISVNAENITAIVKGKVVDLNNEPIPYASVALEGTSIGAVTNFNGEFEILNVPAGHCHIVASCVGFRTDKKHFDVKLGQANTLTFKINEDFIGLDQVVVTADRNKIKRKDSPVVVNSISTKLLQQTSASNLADGLVFSPGLRVENDCNNCGFSQVRMNGLEGPYTQILINSRPIFSGLAGVYGLEHIPSNMIQRVEVVRGGGSALFGGNAIAGTINIITKDPISNSFKAGVKYGAVGVGADGAGSVANDITADFNASVVSEDHKSGIFIFGMNRQREDWDANDDGYSDLVKLENISAGLRAYHKFTDLSKLTFEYHVVDEFRRGGDQLNLPAHQAKVAEQVKHRINSGGLVWDQFFNKDRNSKFSVFASAQHIDRDSYYGAATTHDENGVELAVRIPDYGAYGKTEDLAISTGAQFYTKMNNLLFAPADLTFGIENTYNKLKDDKLGYYDIEKKEFTPTTNIADQKSNTIGAFAQSKWDLGFMNFLLGVRMDSYNVKNDENGHEESNTVFSPRANVLFKLSEPMQFRMSYARGFRAPQIFDEDLHIEASGARRIIHENDPNLKEETSNSYTASLDYTKSFGKTQTYFLVEGFFTDLIDPFVNEFSEVDASGNMVMLRKNANGAVVKGMNFEFKLAPSHKWDFQMGMTVQSSKYDDAVDQGEDDDTANTTTDEILRTPETYGYFALNWKPLHEFTTTLSGSYTGPMSLIHLGGGADEMGNEIQESLVKSDRFTDLGINFSYHFDLGRDVKLQFDCGVKNIFNSFQDDFDYGSARDAGYVYGPLNPRTVYFGVKLGNIL